MAKYEIHPGKYPCHTCKVEVNSVRFYKETKELTWLCKNNHLSTVSLAPVKKSKKDYEREG